MQAICQSLSRLKLGSETAFGNLTLFPVLQTEQDPQTPHYLTLDEALTDHPVAIAEISERGSICELLLVNEGDRPVLLLDGEELLGAKQNRILNLSILAPPHCQLKIPVSCVEAGRWQRQSAEFVSSPHAFYASGRVKKMFQIADSLRCKGRRLSNQGAVWGDIEMKFQRLGTHSCTQAMAEMYEQCATRLADYVRAFSAQPAQVGVLFAIADKTIGLDLFDSPTTLRKLLPKLVRSYALDVLDPDPLKRHHWHNDPVSPQSFLATLQQMQFEPFPTVGEGEDVRLTGPNAIGSALVVRGEVVHLSAFWLEDDSSPLM